MSLAHLDALRISRALVERAGVVPDFRGPDRLRLGPSPTCTSHVEVWDAVDRIAALVSAGQHRDVDVTDLAVT